MRILVTGGAGFIGSRLSLGLRERFPTAEIVALDNLRRRGSEMTLAEFHRRKVAFRHGDIRVPQDLEDAGPADLLIDCSAEASVLAGYDGSPGYVIQANLIGLINCLDHLRRHGGDLIFLSTSRVYPVRGLRELPLVSVGERFGLAPDQSGEGWSASGISEAFPLAGSRTLYGGTKLAAELLIEEYASLYGLRATVNRCGVVAGPWQMGKVEQGFVSLWVARHAYGGKLTYLGFGGEGRQVRDVLHVDDLVDLVSEQATCISTYAGRTQNVGGGPPNTISLRELTGLCREVTGNYVSISKDRATHPGDIPYYVSDCSVLSTVTSWRPRRNLADIVGDLFKWLREEQSWLGPMLTG
jgi:CDP-paratose 2-epimerase